MKKKHTYKSVDVEGVEVAALVAAMVAACIVPGALDPAACIVALDVAKEKFFAALSDARGQVVQILRFVHPKQTVAFLKLLLELKSNKLDVQVVLEPTGTYGDAVKHQCHQRGLAVYEVSPKRTHDMAEVLDGVPSMHDAKAAAALAQLHALGKSRRWEPQSRERKQLRALVDRRVVYSDPLQQHWGRLEALLTRYWPELGEVMDLGQSRSWMTLLSKYEGPEAVVQAAEQARGLLQVAARGALSADRIEEVIASARETLGVPMQSTERKLLGELVSEMQRLGKKEDEIDREIALRVESDPVMRAMSAKVGPAAAAALMAYVGAPQEYASARAYEKATGLNLKLRSSGKHEGKLKITKRGPSRVRQLLYMAALRCCQDDEIVRAWYEQREGYKAKVKKKAVVAVMRKLVRGLWCIGHDPTNPKAFDSSKLFDTRRLSMHKDRVDGAEALVSSSGSPKQSGKRTARIPSKSSALEAHP